MTGRHPHLRAELERVARPADARVPAAAPRRRSARLPAFRLTRRALGRAA